MRKRNLYKTLYSLHTTTQTTMASLATSTNENHQWMWMCEDRTLPALWTSETPMQPPLISHHDPLELAEKRVIYHLERCQKIIPLHNDIPTCERALELFAIIKESPTEAAGGQLMETLTELNLHTFKENGPLSCASPLGMEERTLHYAQLNWETVDESMPWTDQATLEWVLYGLRSNEQSVAFAALSLIGHVNHVAVHETASGSASRTSEEIFSLLHPLPEHPLWNELRGMNELRDMVSLEEFKEFCQAAADGLLIEEEDDSEGFIGFTVAGCDVCQASLFLPEFQRCPMACPLQVREVTAMKRSGSSKKSSGSSKSSGGLEDSGCVCSFCKCDIQVGAVIRGCQQCNFDLCQTCGGPWWHKKPESDLCIHHYDEKQEGYVRINAKEDLGDALGDYFSSEGEGEWLTDDEEQQEEAAAAKGGKSQGGR